jgi:hypothetical protein
MWTIEVCFSALQKNEAANRWMLESLKHASNIRSTPTVDFKVNTANAIYSRENAEKRL